MNYAKFIRYRNQMLTETDNKIIADIEGESTELCELKIACAYKGVHAYTIYNKLVDLDYEWLDTFTESDKNHTLLLVIIQTTVSNASLRDPPASPRRKLLLYFYSNKLDSAIRSEYGYTSPGAKRWRKTLNDAGASV